MTIAWFVFLLLAVPWPALAQEGDTGATVSQPTGPFTWLPTPFPVLPGATSATTGMMAPLSSLLGSKPTPAVSASSFDNSSPSPVNNGPATPNPTMPPTALETNAIFPAAAVQLYARECMAATVVLLCLFSFV